MTRLQKVAAGILAALATVWVLFVVGATITIVVLLIKLLIGLVASI